MSTYRLSRSNIRNLEGVDPLLLDVIVFGLSVSKYDIFIDKDGGLRTPTQQNKRFQKGLEHADGFDIKSPHQKGRAVKMSAFVDGKESKDPMHLTHIAAAMLQAASHLGVKITWCGFWTNFADLQTFILEEQDE